MAVTKSTLNIKKKPQEGGDDKMTSMSWEQRGKELKTQKKAQVAQDEQLHENVTSTLVTKSTNGMVLAGDLQSIYGGSVNLGAEKIDNSELRTPSIVIIQKTTTDKTLEGVADYKIGMLLRTDTKQAAESFDTTILCFDKVDSENYNKTGTERKHIYYGVHEDSIDFFRMYLRSWSLNGSREFLTEVRQVQAKLRMPIFALKVRLSTVKQDGTAKDGNPYSTHRMIMTILKDEQGMPLYETDPGRAMFLKDAAERFSKMAPVDEEEENHVNGSVATTDEPPHPGDIPF